MARRIVGVVVLVATLSLRAETPAPVAALGKEPATWTVEDVVNSESASDFRFAPDGRSIVWVKRSPDKDRGERVSHLIRTDMVTGRAITLTRGAESCTAPRWSPDGKYIAFLSARALPHSKDRAKAEDKDQIWLLDPYGGEPWPLTELSRNVLAYDWAGPEAMIFAAQEEPTLRESGRDEKKDTAQVIEDERHEPFVRLFRVALGSRKVTRLTENGDRIETLAVSAGGTHAVTIHSRSLRYAYDNRIKPVVMLHDLSAGTSKQVFAEAKFNIHAVCWATDGAGFYAVNHHSNRPEFVQAGVLEVYWFDLAAGTIAKVDLGWDRGLAEQTENGDAPGLSVTPDGFVALLANGMRNQAARFTRVGDRWRRELLKGPNVDRLFALEVSADGKAIAFAHSAADQPTRWLHSYLDANTVGPALTLAALNDDLAKKPRAKYEIVRWKGALDEEVEGILHYPHHYQAGQRYPLIVAIHGGPAAADLDAWEETWSYAANLLCQRGAFVLKPNYHGSSNYGLKWLDSIAGGKYLDLEPIDIEKGVDQLISRGLVDPNRLGLYGWSNGAIITNALVTRTTRYRAAVVGAGSIEYVSDWALCEFGDAFDRYYFGKSPLEDAAMYLTKSPFFKLERVRTPTLIFHGADDRVVSAHQGWVQFRALQQLGKTEVRFVVFPGEKHSLKKLAHQRRKLEEELAWFDRHLFGGKKVDEPSLKPDSPLAAALKRREARREGKCYGVLDRGVLIPETVAHAGTLVGRFEVTWAQYAMFEPKYVIEPGHENYPVNGVTCAQAQAYCEWLSKTTGRTYRLPTEEEAEELYESSDGQENTLDHWAGYSPNPDDAKRLGAKAAELGPGALLLEVGSLRGTGTGEMVFDLGGNVAEWVMGKDGKGMLRGGSADRISDGRRALAEPAPEYRGFRVIVGK